MTFWLDRTYRGQYGKLWKSDGPAKRQYATQILNTAAPNSPLDRDLGEQSIESQLLKSIRVY
jgi:hypothetical protein